MARPRGRPFVVGRQKRLTEWSQLADQSFISVASGAQVLISSVSFENPGTVIRSRGSLEVRFNTLTADAAINGAFGIGLVSAEALSVGTTALPGPHSDADWGGWMVWVPFAKQLEFGDATGRFFSSFSVPIDSKAMRKFDPSSAMVFMAESQSGAFDIIENVRLLIKLH